MRRRLWNKFFDVAATSILEISFGMVYKIEVVLKKTYFSLSCLIFSFSAKTISSFVATVKKRIESSAQRTTSTGKQPSNSSDEVSTANVLIIDHDGEIVALTRYVPVFLLPWTNSLKLIFFFRRSFFTFMSLCCWIKRGNPGIQRILWETLKRSTLGVHEKKVSRVSKFAKSRSFCSRKFVRLK